MSGGEIQIGRSMDCAIRTDDAMVSRHHARLYWANGQYYLEDLGSANGVYYQEQRVTRHLLKHGDAVRCGSLWLRFVSPEAAAQPGPQAGPDAYPQHAAQPGYSEPYPAMPQPGGGMSPPVPGPAMPPEPMPRPVSEMGQPMTGPHTPAPVTGGHAQMPAEASGPAVDDAEVQRLKRRIEQLETELRLYRRGRGEEVAKRIEELDERNEALREERGKLDKRVKELENMLQIEGSDAKAQRAQALVNRTGELVGQLNDLLSNLRINVMAAEGEFEQFSHEIPRASFELIRESLRSSSQEVDLARDLLRELRDLAG